MAEDTKRKEWHLHVGVPLSIIAAILFQSGCFVWYGAKLDSRVQQTYEQVITLQAWKDKQDDDRSKIDAHLAVVDEKLGEQGKILQRIDERTEKMLQQRK